jgi:uncharacterized OB-fold protein
MNARSVGRSARSILHSSGRQMLRECARLFHRTVNASMSGTPQLPEPHADADSMAYWSGADAGKLVIRRCGACGRHHFPPRPLCPGCWSDDLHWVEASGEGTVYTFTVMHRAPSPEFAARTPYVVALVDLAEGPRMMANIVGCATDELKLGDRVRVCFETRGGHQLPQFARASG